MKMKRTTSSYRIVLVVVLKRLTATSINHNSIDFACNLL